MEFDSFVKEFERLNITSFSNDQLILLGEITQQQLRHIFAECVHRLHISDPYCKCYLQDNTIVRCINCTKQQK